MKIISIVGARPNFMKVAPLHKSFVKSGIIQSKILHTGQHYDEKMSDIFFNQLELPKPDFYLGVGGGSHTFQKAHVMLKFEEIVVKEKPNIVLVVGDVNPTPACSIVSVKMGIPTVHIEAGLRSGDRSMPEEINRIITDVICHDLFVTEHSGLVNLARENVPAEKVHFVGNVMIDSLINYREASKELSFEEVVDKDLVSKEYILMTMHRPHNVDYEEGLENILKIIEDASKLKRVIFPIHPRTSNNFEKFNLIEKLSSIENLTLLPPQGYLQFLKLMDNAALIITDSGGIQEETTYLQVPCITFRDTTERPISVELGTNYLMSDLDPVTVLQRVNEIFSGNSKKGVIPPLWDGKTAERITQILIEKYSNQSQTDI